MASLIYEQHMHTPLCRHAEGEPEEYAAVAHARGLAGIVVTCHNAMPESYGHSGRMSEAQVENYVQVVERAREAWAGRLDIRLGLEADFFPGYEAFVEQQLRQLPFNHVLGSVHPHLAIWRRNFGQHDPATTQRNYFRHLAEAAETKLFDTISHPDLIKNQTARDWDFEAIVEDVGACLDRIAKTGVAMELNTSGLLKHIPEMNPNPLMLSMMRQRGIPVVVGADAHTPGRVADHFELAYDLLEQAGYTHVSIFLDRRRRDIAIAEARASLIPATHPAPTRE